jgi:ethanolamine permease
MAEVELRTVTSVVSNAGYAEKEENFDNDTNSRTKRYFANEWHLLAMCLLGVLSNAQSGWSVAVGSGLGVQIVSSLAFGIPFVLYYISVSELTSTFPFPGGSYGLARCTLGFFPGYIVGCLEVALYVMVLGLYNGLMAFDIMIAFPDHKNYLTMFFILMFLLQVVLCYSKRVFWYTLVLCAVCAFVINCVYIFGAMRYANFDKWAYSQEESKYDDTVISSMADDYLGPTHARKSDGGSLFVGDGFKVFKSIIASVGGYSGPEFVNLTCDDVRNPRKQIPIAQITAAVVLLIGNVIMPILASSMAPGASHLSNQLSPLIPSMAPVFGCTRLQALFLQIPCMFGYSLCLCYALTKIICAMSESRLFPVFFAHREEQTRVPMRAMIFGFFMAFLAIFVCAMPRDDFEWIYIWPNLIAILLILVDGSQLVGYIIVKLKLPHFPRYFTSPFGITGAVIALANFALALVCGVGFRKDSPVNDYMVLCYLGICTAIYFLVVKHFQEFSAVEKAVMVPVHAEILNANGKIYCEQQLQ